MLFDQNVVDALKDNPISVVTTICDTAIENINSMGDGWSESDYMVLLEAYALISTGLEEGYITIDAPYIDLNGDQYGDCSKIFEYLRRMREKTGVEASKQRLEDFKAHFKTSLSSGFCYEFTQGDLTRIQELINTLRDELVASALFEEDHKQRLLKRIEKLQAELHKKVSDLDKFWGLVGDAGVVLGKFGKDAKPLVDRITEIAKIVWQTQARAEELPSGTDMPLLSEQDEKIA